MPHVYCLHSDGRYKIGFTRGPVAKRLKALQTGHPLPLEIYATRTVGTVLEARGIERYVLQDLRALSFDTVGEWSDAPETLVRRTLLAHRFTLT